MIIVIIFISLDHLTLLLMSEKNKDQEADGTRFPWECNTVG